MSSGISLVSCMNLFVIVGAGSDAGERLSLELQLLEFDGNKLRFLLPMNVHQPVYYCCVSLRASVVSLCIRAICLFITLSLSLSFYRVRFFLSFPFSLFLFLVSRISPSLVSLCLSRPAVLFILLLPSCLS